MRLLVRPFGPAQNQKGFTLIEVILAITILSILMVYVINIIDSSATTKETIGQEDREYLEVLTALELIESDLSQIYSPLYFSITKIDKDTPGIGIAGELFRDVQETFDSRSSEIFPELSRTGLPIPLIENETPQELIFFTTSGRRKVYDSPQSKFQWVRYRIQDSPEPTDAVEPIPTNRVNTQMITRSNFTENPYREDIDWSSVDIREHSLLKGVKDFQFSFWNESSEEYVSLLRQDGTNPQSPKLIKVSFTWVSSAGEEYDFERTYRPLWPKFNRIKERTIRIKIMQETVKRRREAERAQDQNRERERNQDQNQGQGGFN